MRELAPQVWVGTNADAEDAAMLDARGLRVTAGAVPGTVGWAEGHGGGRSTLRVEYPVTPAGYYELARFVHHYGAVLGLALLVHAPTDADAERLASRLTAPVMG